MAPEGPLGVHKNMPLESILSQLNPVHIFISYFNIILNLGLGVFDRFICTLHTSYIG
jgi:hypothetical protein